MSKAPFPGVLPYRQKGAPAQRIYLGSYYWICTGAWKGFQLSGREVEIQMMTNRKPALGYMVSLKKGGLTEKSERQEGWVSERRQA